MPTKPSPRNTRTSFVLPADLHARLLAEHARSGAPLAEIIRRALHDYLAPRELTAKKGGPR